MTHINGPWKAQEYMSPAGRWYVEDANGETVAGGITDSTVARLIAVAPAWHETFKALEELFNETIDYQALEDNWEWAREITNNALSDILGTGDG